MPSITKLVLALSIVQLSMVPAAAIDGAPRLKMGEGRVSVTPLGFKNFCKSWRDHCRIFQEASTSERVVMDSDRFDELSEVNSTVNARIRPVPEFRLSTSFRDDWKLPTNSGDCEDYALLKQARLIEKGWPKSALLITVADMQDGTRHAVLTVRTDAGDYILDNVTDRILDWQGVNYRWIKRQSARNMMRWVEIKAEPAPSAKATDSRETLLDGLII